MKRWAWGGEVQIPGCIDQDGWRSGELAMWIWLDDGAELEMEMEMELEMDGSTLLPSIYHMWTSLMDRPGGKAGTVGPGGD